MNSGCYPCCPSGKPWRRAASNGITFQSKTSLSRIQRRWVVGETCPHGCIRSLSAGARFLCIVGVGWGVRGTISAQILIERGRSAADAIREVRSVRRGAVETVEQKRWLESNAQHHGRPGFRLHGSLIGGAIGDSLGAVIEFLSLDEIRRRFPEGVSDLPPHQGLRGAITDDTQMTLFTAEGMIRAHIRGALKGICHPPSVVHHALLRWHRTQGGKPRVETDDIGLISDPRMWARRAPRQYLPVRTGEERSLRDACAQRQQGLRHDHARRTRGPDGRA